jgi:hypothetical protein
MLKPKKKNGRLTSNDANDPRKVIRVESMSLAALPLQDRSAQAPFFLMKNISAKRRGKSINAMNVPTVALTGSSGLDAERKLPTAGMTLINSVPAGINFVS